MDIGHRRTVADENSTDTQGAEECTALEQRPAGGNGKVVAPQLGSRTQAGVKM